jgi:hypothetical protein
MTTRRSLLQAGLRLCVGALCGPPLVHLGGRAHADEPRHVRGRGYELHFIGAQRETIMNGRLAATLDLRTLADRSHLYGMGPIEQLRGEVTIAERMSGNICRCSAYPNIVAAIREVAGEGTQ